MKSILEISPKESILHEMSDDAYAVVSIALKFSGRKSVAQTVAIFNDAGLGIKVSSRPWIAKEELEKPVSTIVIDEFVELTEKTKEALERLTARELK